MKKAIVLMLVASLVSFSCFAKIFRVGYSGPQVSGTDYANVQLAVDAASAGDTIQLYQNNIVGSAYNITKKLVFIGYGYLLQNNPGLQATEGVLNGADLTFKAGSEFSIVQGVLIGSLRIGTNDITISRCRVGYIYLGYNGSSNVAVNSISIIGCSLETWFQGNYGNVSNLLVANSIIRQYFYIPNVSGLLSNNLIQNTVGYGFEFGSTILKNNIIVNILCQGGSSAVFHNNIFSNSCTSFVGQNNSYNVNMNDVFINWNGGNFGSETNLTLKTGSPAIGFGSDGNGNPTDAGIYGGEPGFVYKPSGIPAIPSIYKLTAPLNTSTNPYTITVGVRSNN